MFYMFNLGLYLLNLDLSNTKVLLNLGSKKNCDSVIMHCGRFETSFFPNETVEEKQVLFALFILQFIIPYH